MSAITVLLVDDDEIIRHTLSELLRLKGFEVTTAASVLEALKLIQCGVYDVLLSDLHMPRAGDGLTVVSAMRHSNPKAITLLLTSFPEMEVAAQQILQQADAVLLKPMDIHSLVDTIMNRMAQGPGTSQTVETVADIMERSTAQCIEAWFEQVRHDDMLLRVTLTRDQRCSHLHQMFRDLVARLNTNRRIGMAGPLSVAAADHGRLRRAQGYSASMLVEESRILQVTIFNMLQNNLSNLDFSTLLSQVMAIADEVDSQLRQAMEAYANERVVVGMSPGSVRGLGMESSAFGSIASTSP